MANRTGQQFGNYRLIRLLGQGGFADVYLAEHIHLDTRAAIKVLSMRLTSDNVEHFRIEAYTVAHLVHTHIVRVLNFGVEDGTPYLIMDYAPNGSLRQRHPKGTHLPLTTVVDYVKQVAEALQYAHEKKLIHRDVKPENMLLGENQQVLLSDFGIALVAQSTGYQSIQEVIGTAAYMAPEQLQGRPRRASDQYALGIVVYEWLCGKRPFQGSFPELYSQHLLVPPPSLCEKVPELPLTVEEVVLTALAKDPDQRFPNVQAFAMALEQAYQSAQFHPPDSSVVAAHSSDQSSLLDSITTSPSQHSSPTDTFAAILPGQVTQALDGVTSPSQPLEPTNTLTPAGQSTQLTNIIPPSTAPAFSLPGREPEPSGGLRQPLPPQRLISRRAIMVGLVGLTGISIVGGGIAWLTRPQKLHVFSPSSHPTIASSHTSSPTSTPIAAETALVTYVGHSEGVETIAWSPDGTRIASAGIEETVQVWGATDGVNRFTYYEHGFEVLALAWSPSGKYIAAGSAGAIVQVLNATTRGNNLTYQGHSNEAQIYPGQPNEVWGVTWSPDGKHIASASTDRTVQVWDATTGGLIYIYRGHADSVLAVAWSPKGKYIASGSGDKTVQIWDATTGSHVYTYHGHSKWVTAVAWSPDGTLIASASADGTVQIWQAL